MIRLKIVGNWNDDWYVYKQFQTFTKDGIYWNQIELVKPGENFDYLLIVNHPRCQIQVDPKRVIIMQYEPEDARKFWQSFFHPDPDMFFAVFDISYSMTIPCWQIDRTWRWLTTHDITKSKTISGCISDKTTSPYGDMRAGRLRRIDFICEYLSRIPEYEHFGNITQPNKATFQNLSCYCGAPEKKEDTLFPYQYTFAAENGQERNYFTEKILDSVLSECVAFYAGCPNISDFVDPCCYIEIDLKHPEVAINTVKSSIDNGEWGKRIAKIRKEKTRILHEFTVFPVLEKMFKEKGVL